MPKEGQPVPRRTTRVSARVSAEVSRGASKRGEAKKSPSLLQRITRSKFSLYSTAVTAAAAGMTGAYIEHQVTHDADSNGNTAIVRSLEQLDASIHQDFEKLSTGEQARQKALDTQVAQIDAQLKVISEKLFHSGPSDFVKLPNTGFGVMPESSPKQIPHNFLLVKLKLLLIPLTEQRTVNLPLKLVRETVLTEKSNKL